MTLYLLCVGFSVIIIRLYFDHIIYVKIGKKKHMFEKSTIVHVSGNATVEVLPR